MADFEREYSNNTDSIDFSEGLGSSFGVEETTMIAKDQLDSFLLNEPITQTTDTSKIEKVEDQPKPDTKDKSRSKEKEQTQIKDSEEATSTLTNWLLSDNKKDSKKTEDTPQEDNQDINTDSNKEENIEPEENQFVTLSKDFYKLGVFTQDDEEENEVYPETPEAFLERFNIEKKKGASEIVENFLERFGDDYKDMFQAVFVKGVNPKDYLASYSKIESVKNLDLTNAVNQEKIFVQYYRSEGLSEEKIQKKLEKAKDYGDLADDAADFHELLIQKEEREIARMEEDKQQELYKKQQRENAFQQNVNRILSSKLQDGDFDGIPVTKKEAQDVYQYIVNKPYKLPNGELITEMQKDWLELDRPENHELKVKVALLLRNKMDLSRIQKKAVSNKSDSLFSNLTNKTKTQNRKDSGNNKPTTSFFS